ncbi:uncharacterized protein BDZ99DRAFT_576053 [Mytilinidion resinicola]|uniref:RING-type domain-containing protein n=1 Tax=Mytilinidion resinicola TaxID=574789 RepID=A0A6A6Y4I5_9PEZI|nr:uncharacterized protein BDZ99DRAFT_576053 [Mytilinidion resinicola]KAF2803570.1 hypothetical protein BDZ99DRAFT_576053 [Mytilinidion resinicola]
MAAMDNASSFAQGDIPVKLRCAIDSKLVVNAFRLPCCDQNICGSCQSALPESCPVCAHSPLSADACQPSKGLRLTVSAFIKKEEKKREKERAANTPKPAAATAPAPSATTSSSEQALDTSDQPFQSVEASSSQQDNPNVDGASTTEVGIAGSEAPVDDNQAPEQQLVEASSLPQSLDARRGSTAQAPTSNKSVGRTSAAPESQPQDAQTGVQSGENAEGQDSSTMWNNMNGGQGQMYPGAFGNFNNGMDWSGTTGFNPMMQMPNGMNSGDWNNYSSMMSMPGMNMGPMSQGMFGGFGGQGMGMNGMAGMNMGMNYGGGYGAGWNGQQMSGGHFGGANAGYYPGGGYNQSSQGNFPHQMHQQQFPKNNFQNQNRFQGQGAYPQRGGFGRGHQGNLATQNHGQTYGQNQVPTYQNHSEQKSDDTTDRQTSSGLQDSSIRMTVEQSQVPPDTEAEGVDGGPEKPSDSAENLGPDVSTGNSDIKAEGEQNANSINASGSEHENNETLETSALTRPAEGFAEDTSMNANMDTPTQQFQPIATVDTSEPYSQPFDHQNMNMNMGMEMGMSHDMMGQVYPGQAHQVGIMNGYSHRGRAGARGGFGRGAGHDFRGGFGGRGVQGGGFMSTGAFGGSNTAVLPHSGDVTVLTPGEPRGLGVEGAPTGPKAMREGRPNTGFASRGRFSGPQASGAAHVTPDVSATGSQTRPRSKTPVRDDSLRVRSKSRSKSPVRAKSKSRSHSRSREHRRYRDRSPTPTSETKSREKHQEYDDRRRSSRKYNDDERENFPEESYLEESKDKSKEEPSRGTSVESRYRSRRDREKHRSLRSHRDRSREHRRHRHRSRSRSPVVDEPLEGDENGNDLPSESSSRRKGRSEKYRDRERDRERERDRDRDRETEHDRDRDRGGKDRRRDRERDRKHSRRDRSRSPRYASDDERPHRSSRPSHKDRERDREYTHGHSQSRGHSPPITAPTGPSKAPVAETEFKIQGRSKARNSSTVAPIATNMPPPTQPKSSQAVFQPPKGPAAERSHDRDRDRGSRRRPSSSVPSTPITPTTPTTPAVDPHTLEREARNRERMLKEAQRRASLQNPNSSFSSAEKKRSRDAVDDEDDKPFTPPTGPSSQRWKRRRESDTGVSSKLEDRVGGKGKKGREARRMSYKYEDEENDEARARRLDKMEREREESRWN